MMRSCILVWDVKKLLLMIHRWINGVFENPSVDYDKTVVSDAGARMRTDMDENVFSIRTSSRAD
jgi:hypothetical protein